MITLINFLIKVRKHIVEGILMIILVYLTGDNQLILEGRFWLNYNYEQGFFQKVMKIIFSIRSILLSR